MLGFHSEPYITNHTVFEPDIRGLWIGTRSKLVIEANLGIGTHLQIGLQNASTYDWLIRIFLSLTKKMTRFTHKMRCIGYMINVRKKDNWKKSRFEGKNVVETKNMT